MQIAFENKIFSLCKPISGWVSTGVFFPQVCEWLQVISMSWGDGEVQVISAGNKTTANEAGEGWRISSLPMVGEAGERGGMGEVLGRLQAQKLLFINHVPAHHGHIQPCLGVFLWV